jgi:hypothetical protein
MLFVPSLDYSHASEHDLNAVEYSADDPLAQDCDPPRPLEWEWSRYGANNNTSTATTTPNNNKKRLLIAMFAGFDEYAKLLTITAQVNKAYAKQHTNVHVVVLLGTAMPIYSTTQDNHKGGCADTTATTTTAGGGGGGGRLTTLNKIRLLFHAIDHKETYDQLLLLDADAFIYAFDTDITTLLPDDYMLAAHRVKSEKGDVRQTWNINAGVMLWNLHHAMTRDVAVQWFQSALFSSMQQQQTTINAAGGGESSIEGDQRHLQKVLRRNETFQQNVYSLTKEFAYGHGTVVRHYIRTKEHKEWDDPQILTDRIKRVTKEAALVCQTFHPACNAIPKTDYYDASF